jgi:hypothetical protein
MVLLSSGAMSKLLGIPSSKNRYVMFFRNIGSKLPRDMTPHPRRPENSTDIIFDRWK